MGKLETDFLLYIPKSLLLGYEIRGRIEIEDKIPIRAKINSNEITGHHIPHVHITYRSKDFVCSINDKIQILEPKKYLESDGRIIRDTISIPDNLRKCRTEWNRCQTLIKFNDEQINFKFLDRKKDGDSIIITKLYH